LYQTQHIDDIFYNANSSYKGYPLPLEIELSLVDSCNRTCAVCPRANDEIAPNTSLKMAIPLYKKIAVELKEIGFNGLIMLGGYGEPLLHEHIVDVVKTFNFTYVDIVTNGDLLTETLLNDLTEAGVYRVMISQYEPGEHFDVFKKQVQL
jgi:MoaA/NifB/PqqE/SkfB family radical SAM enzyme